MIYGSNILTSVIADWLIVNGSMTTESITLSQGGTATFNIDLTVLPEIPDSVLISIAASKYANAYAGSLYAILQAIDKDEITYTYNVSIVDTGGGTCIVELPLTAIQHKTLTFMLKSTIDVTFTDWSLFAPKVSDVDLTEITDKLPRLLKDFNTKTMNVGITEDIVALISAYVTDNTELTGHFTLSYKASENCGLIIRIKDNETAELYTPMLFYLQAGSGTVGIPHAYLTRLKGYHNFTVTAQVTNGEIAIDTRKVLYVIDGGRIAYSIMDVGSVAYDLSVRKLVTETKISYIYAICIDEGECLVKKCEYSDTPGAAWLSVASLGPAIDAAIEFNGTWDVINIPYVFSTDEYPWVTWVTPDNKLFAKRLDDDTTLIEIATGITKVCSVKGWDNPYSPGYDQGLLLTYIKTDGLVYYRGLCRQLDGTTIWEVETNLAEFTLTAKEVNTFKTNDFRIGFNVLDSDGVTHTYISTRNWAGMSVPPEHVSVNLLDFAMTAIPITYIDTFEAENISAGLTNYFIGAANPIYPVVTTITNTLGDYTHIKLKFSHPITQGLTGLASAFTVKDANNVAFAVTSTSAGADQTEIILTTANYSAAKNDMVVSYNNGITGSNLVPLLTCANGGLQFTIDNFSTAFTALIEPPKRYATENITVGVSGMVVGVSQVYYRERFDSENISANIFGLSIVVTKVGSNPI